MTQQRVAQHVGVQSLVWLLLLAVALMGLTVTRQQALGSLHLHADQQPQGTSVLAAAVSSLASDWLIRWQHQHLFGHQQLRLGAASDAPLWPSSDFRDSDATATRGTHTHDSLERHHHAVDDGSVVALDAAAEAAGAADSSATGGTILLPVAATPGNGLVLPAIAKRGGPWPVDRTTAFVSRSVAPPLRPPAA